MNFVGALLEFSIGFFVDVLAGFVLDILLVMLGLGG